MTKLKLRIYKNWNQFIVYIPLEVYNALFNLYYNPQWYHSPSSKMGQGYYADRCVKSDVLEIILKKMKIIKRKKSFDLFDYKGALQTLKKSKLNEFVYPEPNESGVTAKLIYENVGDILMSIMEGLPKEIDV